MKTNHLIFINICLILLTVSCQKEEDPNAPKQGSMTGKVRLADEFGNLLADHGQMIITSTNDLKGNTNENGSFLLYGLDDGIHDITFSKVGFGSYKRFSIPVTNPGNTVLEGIDTLGQLSTTIITNLSSTYNAPDSSYSFTCSISPTPDQVQKRGIRLFFSASTNVSSEEFSYTPGHKWMGTSATGTIDGIRKTDLTNNGFNRGDTVYVIAYGESFYSNTYVDPINNKKIFPNINLAHPSNSTFLVVQ